METKDKFPETEQNFRQDSIKDYVFDSLPSGTGQYIIIAWGKIINDRTGSYKQQIVLKRYSEKDSPSKVWNLKDYSNFCYCVVDLGSIKVLSPGTIIQNQKIKYHIEEYLERTQIVINSPQDLERRPFRVMYDPTFQFWERTFFSTPVDKLEIRLFNDPVFGQVVIPSTVIADYYYYGRVYLIKAVLEGKIDLKYKNRNDVFNPLRLSDIITPNGKRVVLVELQRTMDFKDQVKIARLAYDEYFRFKCLDIFTNLTKGTPSDSFINTDLPIQEPTKLSVYGVTVIGKAGRFFLVHSISMCSVKPPFDLVISSKNFRPKGKVKGSELDNQGTEQAQSNSLSNSLSLLTNNQKKKIKMHLEDVGKRNIGSGRPRWDSVSKNLSYTKDQTDNFLDEDTINEKDFEDSSKEKVLTEILHKFGLAIGQSTDPNKKGAENILQLKVFAENLGKPKPAPPTTAFHIIEKISNQITSSLKFKNLDVKSSIRCPVAEGEDKYSSFPTKEFFIEPDINKRKIYLDFSFINVRTKGYSHHRRVFIFEIFVGAHVFYIIDIEPKYKIAGNAISAAKFISTFGVLFYAKKNALDDEFLKGIMKSIVIHQKTSLGRWVFLREKFNFEFQLIKHHPGQITHDKMIQFIARLI